MSNIAKNSIAFASALAISTVAASAATVSTVTIVETTRNFGGTVSVSETTDTANGGDVSISTGVGDSFATQNADGTSVVRATVGFNEREELTTATATFEQSETNTFGMDRDYTLNYTLEGQSADLFWDNGNFFEVNAFALAATAVPTNPENPFGTAPNVLPASTIDVTAASFEYGIEVGGDIVFSARADAIMDGFGIANVVTDAVSGFTPMIVANGNGGVTFSVAPLSGSIFLDTYAAGEEIVVTSFLRASAYTTGFVEIGGAVDILSGDPISLSSVGTLTSVPTNPVSTVPLPAAGWLLIAGLGGLAAARSRKS